MTATLQKDTSTTMKRKRHRDDDHVSMPPPKLTQNFRKTQQISSFHKYYLQRSGSECSSHVSSMDDVKNTHYQYQPLESQEHIRLLHLSPGDSSEPIECEITHHCIELSSSYEALSYEWGLAAEDDPSIFVGGRAIQVRRNLFEALKHIRPLPKEGEGFCQQLASPYSPSEKWTQTQPRTLWVDALCIHQEDEQERNHQVGMMGTIYTEASRVVVWLGLAADGSATAIDYLNKLPLDFETGIPYSTRSLSRFSRPLRVLITAWDPSLVNMLSVGVARPQDDELAAIQKLCSRTYWHRLWIVQEFHLAKRLLIYCGDKSFSGESFQRFYQAQYSQWFRDSWTPLSNSLLQACHESVALALHVQQRCSLLNDGFLSWLEMALLHDLQCAEPRDLIYALLGITAFRRSSLSPEYSKPLIEVILDALELCAQEEYGLSHETFSSCFIWDLMKRMERFFSMPNFLAALMARIESNVHRPLPEDESTTSYLYNIHRELHYRTARNIAKRRYSPKTFGWIKIKDDVETIPVAYFLTQETRKNYTGESDSEPMR